MQHGATDQKPSLGSLIQIHRSRARLTQQELAKKAGLSVATVRDYEQGRRHRLRQSSLNALTGALGLNAEQIADLARSATLPQLSGLPQRPGGPRSRGPRSGGVRDSAGPAVGCDHKLWLAAIGPLEAWQDGTQLATGPSAQRAILGLLALDHGSLVRRESIIDALWGTGPPRTATNLVQAYVSKIRTLLKTGEDPAGGPRELVSVGRAYRLSLSGDELDLLVFRDLAARAAASQAGGDLPAAAGLYEQAVELWRDDPLADVDMLRTHPAVIALNQELTGVLLRYAEVACGLGQPARVLRRLQALTHAETLNESAHAHLMIALASAGQQASAIRAYEDIRLRLNQELGLYPGTELREAYQRVLRQDLPVANPGPVRPGPPPPSKEAEARVIPRQLPGAPYGFAGRTAELCALSRLPEQDRDRASGGSLAAVTGVAGIGKTALVMHWAHQVADQFPDGQLFIDLRGSGPPDEPAAPADAVASFVTALGPPPAQIPADADGQAALYRSLLASRRMLIVLDNARDADQVRPLLPGSSRCVVVVTSRNRLTSLAAAEGAKLIALGALSDSEARDLMSVSLGPGRMRAEAAEVSALIERCGRLPLALRHAAALSLARPELPLSAFAGEGDVTLIRVRRLGRHDEPGSAQAGHPPHRFERGLDGLRQGRWPRAVEVHLRDGHGRVGGQRIGAEGRSLAAVLPQGRGFAVRYRSVQY
jgi:DNA-binding SARP family transcriptional activator/DNA-binding XRE family transcriptional regulator